MLVFYLQQEERQANMKAYNKKYNTYGDDDQLFYHINYIPPYTFLKTIHACKQNETSID
jgi:hypothetical protein